MSDVKIDPQDWLARIEALEARSDQAYERRKEICRDGEARDEEIKTLEAQVKELEQRHSALNDTLGCRVCGLEEQIQGMKITDAALERAINKLEEHACGKIGVIALERSCGMADHQPAAPKPEDAECDVCGFSPEKGNVVYEDSGRRPLCPRCNAKPTPKPSGGTCGESRPGTIGFPCPGMLQCPAVNAIEKVRWREAEERSKTAEAALEHSRAAAQECDSAIGELNEARRVRDIWRERAEKAEKGLLDPTAFVQRSEYEYAIQEQGQWRKQAQWAKDSTENALLRAAKAESRVKELRAEVDCHAGNWREAEERAKKNIVGLRQLVAEENAKHQMEQARAEKAEAKATQYEQDWYSAKSEFGDAMAKMRTRLREAEARVKELEDISHGTKATAEESCEIQEKLCDSCMRRFRADERERVAKKLQGNANPHVQAVAEIVRAMPDEVPK